MDNDLLQRQHLEIQTLRERVRQLEEALAPSFVITPLEWQLTMSEARVFAHMATRAIATKQSIMMALYSNRTDEDPEIKIVDVFVCKMRKKLSRFNIMIDTVWGQGYALQDRANWNQVAV